MIIAKAYDRYNACIADGLSHDRAIEEAAHVWDVPVKALREYVAYWESMV